MAYFGVFFGKKLAFGQKPTFKPILIEKMKKLNNCLII